MSVAPRPHGRALPEAASRRGWCPGLTRPMRIAFAGTPEFAATALSALIDAGHQVALV